jgi:hypothetical protein
MTITYRDGRQVTAFILSRSEERIRVTVPGCDDPIELNDRNGTWVTEDCEPVRIQFAWQRRTRPEILSEADCICSHQLAARLIHLLMSESEEEELRTACPPPSHETPTVWA